MSNYPDGVTDADIDYYFGEDETVRCETCKLYDDGFCILKIEVAEELAEEDEWTMEEKESFAMVTPDSYCDQYC